jgi:hypothetical protein
MGQTLEPAINPSYLLTSNIDSHNATNNQYNMRKKDQEFQNNAVSAMTIQEKQALKSKQIQENNRKRQGKSHDQNISVFN